MIKTEHRIIIGDSRKMAETADNSVHLIVTSPPYWQLKDYGSENQIGFNNTYQDYINNLNLVWKECCRVLYPGCRMVINIGDQFARSIYYKRYKVIPIRTEIIKFTESAGFDYMGAIIWQKKTTMQTTGGATVMGSYPFPRNGIVEIDYEFILIFKKPGKPPVPERTLKEKSRLSKEEWKEYFSGHWNFPGERQLNHIAMFPEELPKRIIKMFSFIGDTVLDPFLGSGTTSLAAKNLFRNSTGYETNEDFLPIIKDKIGMYQKTLFADFEIEIIKQSTVKADFRKEIETLPYVFQDLVKFNKIHAPELRQTEVIKSQQNNYYYVKKVVSPEIILLNNGLTVRLTGIKENPLKRSEAVDFLEKKTKGQKVILKYDDRRYDRNNNLMCYMYLKNKTFINAHLIKRSLVDVDTSSDYKYRSKFLSYAGNNN